MTLTIIIRDDETGREYRWHGGATVNEFRREPTHNGGPVREFAEAETDVWTLSEAMAATRRQLESAKAAVETNGGDTTNLGAIIARMAERLRDAQVEDTQP